MDSDDVLVLLPDPEWLDEPLVVDVALPVAGASIEVDVGFDPPLVVLVLEL